MLKASCVQPASLAPLYLSIQFQIKSSDRQTHTDRPDSTMVSDGQADGDEQGQLALKDRFASPAKSMSVVVAAIKKFELPIKKYY